MKKLFALIIAAGMLLCLAACGEAEETGPAVALTDVAAEAVPADEIAPADLNEVAIATEEMILNQPMDAPMTQPLEPAPGEPTGEPAEEGEALEEGTAEEE